MTAALRWIRLTTGLVAAMFAILFMPVALARPLTAADARTISKEAYIYGFPMVDHYRIQHAYFIDHLNPEYKGPWNTIHNDSRVYTPRDRAIQTPNSDTPYSHLGADLRTEPLILTMPEVPSNRYYVAQFIDLYTHNFDYVGSRSTGNGAGRYLLCGPRWKGRIPKGIDKVIRAETDLVFVFYRTQLFGPSDIENVRKIQSGYRVQTLSQYLGEPAPKPAPKIPFIQPLNAIDERTSPHFFAILDFLLRGVPSHPSETALRQRLARLGIGGGVPFTFDALPPDIQRAIRAGMADAWTEFDAMPKRTAKGELSSVDFFGTRGHLKSNYLYRMAGAVRGIYGNSKDEAVYGGYYVDAVGQKLDGKARYQLRFGPGQLPKVRAFWSLTMYRLPDRMLVDNPIDRYLINSTMLTQLKRDSDGGITLYIQHFSPGSDKEDNWLPAPDAAFFLGLRAYWPAPEMTDGTWTKPVLERVD